MHGNTNLIQGLQKMSTSLILKRSSSHQRRCRCLLTHLWYHRVWPKRAKAETFKVIYAYARVAKRRERANFSEFNASHAITTNWGEQSTTHKIYMEHTRQHCMLETLARLYNSLLLCFVRNTCQGVQKKGAKLIVLHTSTSNRYLCLYLL